MPISSIEEAIYHASTIKSALEALSTGIQNTTIAFEAKVSTSSTVTEISRFVGGKSLLSLPDEIIGIIANELQRSTKDKKPAI